MVRLAMAMVLALNHGCRSPGAEENLKFAQGAFQGLSIRRRTEISWHVAILWNRAADSTGLHSKRKHPETTQLDGRNTWTLEHRNPQSSDGLPGGRGITYTVCTFTRQRGSPKGIRTLKFAAVSVIKNRRGCQHGEL